MKYFIKLLLLFIFVTVNSHSIELTKEKEISKISKQLFLNNGFKSLTSNSNDFLKNKDRTLEGKWKLRSLYKGVFDSFNINIKDEQYWNSLEKKLLVWQKKYPHSSISYISYASYLYHKAWMYRGGNSGENVTKMAFQNFYKEMKNSKEYLLKYKDIASNDPQWYVLMLSLARGEGMPENEFSELFDEALHKHPNYDALYEFSIYYMKPNWNNFSKEKIEQYAQRVLKFSKDKDGSYAKFYMLAKDNIYHDAFFYKSDVNWSTMKNSFSKLIKSYPTQHNFNQFAYYSCLKDDRSTLRELMNNKITKPIISIWKSQDNYDRCKKLAMNQKVDDSYKITTIKPNELNDYIQNATEDKAQLFYFGSYPKQCKICDINYFKKLAKRYEGKVEFVSVNLYPEKSIFKYPNVYKPYYMTSTPSMMLVYKKKIIRRMHYIDFVTKYKEYIQKIDSTIKELDNPNFLTMFSTTINNKASYVNSHDEIRFLDPLYLSATSYKARACSVNLYKNRIAIGQAFSFHSQDEANKLALLYCERQKARFGLKDECKFHRLNKKYVYEDTIPKIKKNKISIFKNILSNNIKKHIVDANTTKPQYIYFKRSNKNIANGVLNLSKEFNSSIDFISVDIDNINSIDIELKKYFGLRKLPSSVLVYKKKIILTNNENHFEKFWIQAEKEQIEYFLNNLNNKKYLDLFSEGLNNNYYLEYNSKIRTYSNKRRYLKLSKPKAWFTALGNSYSVYGWGNDSNLSVMLRNSYINCKMNSIGYNIPNDCQLYMLNDEYVYNKPVNSMVSKIQDEIKNGTDLVKSIEINELDKYIKNNSQNKPLYIYFGGDKNTQEVLELMAKLYKSKINFVWLNLDENNSDLLHQKIKKKFNIKRNFHTVIFFKDKTIFSSLGRLDGNGNYGRKKILELLSKIQ